MVEVAIQGGARFHTTSPDEARQIFRDELRERDEARTVKYVEFMIPVTAAATVQSDRGPEQGYVWSLKLVAMTLVSAGTATVYKAAAQSGGNTQSTDTRRPIGYQGTSATTSIVTWSSNQVMLKPGQSVLMTASQNITSYYLCAEQVMAERAVQIMD